VNTRLLTLLSAALSAHLLVSCQHADEGSETRPAGENVLDRAALREAKSGTVSFESHVKPVLEAKCVACHQREALPARLNLESRAAARRTGALGAFIVPGAPERSLFLTKLGEAHASVQAMPPVGETLTKDEVAILRRWIAQGADWPEGAAGMLKTRP